MRYDKAIYFQKISPGAYNPDTGDYGEDSIEEERRLASVADTGTETMNIVYGSIKQGSLTIQPQTHYRKPFDFIRIGRRKYRVDLSRELRTKHIFVVSEVQ